MRHATQQKQFGGSNLNSLLGGANGGGVVGGGGGGGGQGPQNSPVSLAVTKNANSLASFGVSTKFAREGLYFAYNLD